MLEVKAKLLDGSFVIFKGPLKDNTGKIVIPAGVRLEQTAVELERWITWSKASWDADDVLPCCPRRASRMRCFEPLNCERTSMNARYFLLAPRASCLSLTLVVGMTA